MISFTNSKYSEFEHFKNCVNLSNFLFRALNDSKLEGFRTLKSPELEDFRVLKSSNLAVGFWGPKTLKVRGFWDSKILHAGDGTYTKIQL